MNIKNKIYYASILLCIVYWFFISSPRYLSQADIIVQERRGDIASAISGTSTDEHYVISADGRAVINAWLRSEAPFWLIEKNGVQPGLYSEKNRFIRLFHLGSLHAAGDWRRWQHFRKSLKITESPESTSIALSSFDPGVSCDVLREIMRGAERYLLDRSREEDALYQMRANNAVSYYQNKLSTYEDAHHADFQTLAQTILPNIYLRREHLLEKMRDATLAYALKEKNYGLGAANSSGLNLQIDWLRKELGSVDRELAENRDLLSREAIRDAYVKGIIQQLVQYDRPNISSTGQLYIPRYKITYLSEPARFSQEFGPYRVRSLIITLIVISVLYWIVKD